MEFHFIYHSYHRFFGYRETWITTQEQAMVSDLEKTNVDAVSKPQLCGGIAGVGKTIYDARERTEIKQNMMPGYEKSGQDNNHPAGF